MALLAALNLEVAALRGGPATWWWKNKGGAPWCSLCRRYIKGEHVGSDRHVAKVDWEVWLAHLPDPIQLAQPLDWELPALDQGYQQADHGQAMAQPLDWEPPALDQGYQQAEQGQAVARSWHVAHVPALPFVAQQRCSAGGSQPGRVVDDADGTRRRIRPPDRDPGGNWIKQWSETHGTHYFWNDRDARLVAWEIPDYSVAYHTV